MRLVRFGPAGSERPGLMQQGKVIDLTSVFADIPDIGEVFFRDGWLDKVRGVSAGESVPYDRLGCPVRKPGKIICLGINYREHTREAGFDQPENPLLFAKAPNALSGPTDPILLPRSCSQIDWEVELAVVIGKKGKRIPKRAAFDHIAGVTVMNDVSGRQAQFADGQWFRGKSFDTFAPMGPAIVTLDEIGDIQNLHLTSLVDGQVMQDGSTADMIFPVAELIEFISEDITLLPGDVISTGTPSGVGIFRDPPVLLQPGNVVECRVEKIGSIVNPVVAER
ncbi:MAG: fumarylacetoacetate hydrolase [Deltaproteobacteria bacterium SG8_13]|nr:MAG: fumarylacetoacetate hydrolase [Deltaproteobacteria bacterium SG8_13]